MIGQVAIGARMTGTDSLRKPNVVVTSESARAFERVARVAFSVGVLQIALGIAAGIYFEFFLFDWVPADRTNPILEVALLVLVAFLCASGGWCLGLGMSRRSLARNAARAGEREL